MPEFAENLIKATAYMARFGETGVLNRIGGVDSAGAGWFETTSPVDGSVLA
jgi:5-carboxymethyl-2-hydroxymuconic-semialdehyde dehydrogenase